MNKELEEAFYILKDTANGLQAYLPSEISNACNVVNQSLTELKAIKEAKPSEAITYINALIKENDNDIKNQNNTGFDIDTQAKWVKYLEHKSTMLSTIKQTLLKAQENEKVLEIIRKKLIDTVYLRLCFKTSNGLEKYNNCHKVGYKLTEEEFELLREMC